MRRAIEILTMNGWSSDYIIDPNIHINKINQLGFKINNHVIDFLSKFGGMEIEFTTLNGSSGVFTTDFTTISWPKLDHYGSGFNQDYCYCGCADGSFSEIRLLFISSDGKYHVDIYEFDEFEFENLFDSLEYIFS